MKDIVKEYTNGEITVVWKPNVCIHSANCFHGLPRVFNPENKPWVNIKGADSATIAEQIKQCPSGALSYYYDKDSKQREQETAVDTPESYIEVTPDGPLMVHGKLKIKLADGTMASKTKTTAFCRCGGSANKPFCDGTHRKNNFKG